MKLHIPHPTRIESPLSHVPLKTSKQTSQLLSPVSIPSVSDKPPIQRPPPKMASVESQKTLQKLETPTSSLSSDISLQNLSKKKWKTVTIIGMIALPIILFGVKYLQQARPSQIKIDETLPPHHLTSPDYETLPPHHLTSPDYETCWNARVFTPLHEAFSPKYFSQNFILDEIDDEDAFLKEMFQNAFNQNFLVGIRWNEDGTLNEQDLRCKLKITAHHMDDSKRASIAHLLKDPMPLFGPNTEDLTKQTIEKIAEILLEEMEAFDFLMQTL